jgi:hypothetical protein
MHQSFHNFEILTAKVSKVQKPYFMKEYVSSSGLERVHTWATMRQDVYTHRLKEGRACTIG